MMSITVPSPLSTKRWYGVVSNTHCSRILLFWLSSAPVFGQLSSNRHWMLVVVAQCIERDQILMRATALTYFAMLALIPILALAIGLVGAFGVSDDLARAVVDKVAAGSPEAGQYILDLVKKVNFGSFGAVGGISLFVTTVLGLGTVERSFNKIWGIERERSLMRRFADYLAVLVVAPLLFTAALSIATSLRSETILQQVLAHPALAQAHQLGLRQTPTVLLLLGFAFLYWFLPNTSVRIGPALLGGAVAAVLFGIAQALYIGFNVGVARSNAIFGSFAALPPTRITLPSASMRRTSSI